MKVQKKAKLVRKNSFWNLSIKAGLLNKSSRGLSILMAILMVTLVTLFSIGVTTVVTDSVRQAGNVRQGTTAFYAAEQGIEQALWLNKQKSLNGENIGLNVTPDQIDIASNTSTKFKITGTPDNLKEKTVNGKYIVPLPWTGNAPWHGEGATTAGGCNPEKPPLRTSGQFSYNDVKYDEIEHPCNWNILKVGEKATIPLYGKDSFGNDFKFSDFTLRVRMPCTQGREMCNPTERMELNCWDKGKDNSEQKCVQLISEGNNNKLRGEVILSWQVNGQNDLGAIFSLIANAALQNAPRDYYLITPQPDKQPDSELFENRINRAKGDSIDNLGLFGVLNANKFGKEVETGIAKKIADFIGAYKKPVLSLSVVSNLIGCDNGGQIDSICTSDDASSKLKIPYLEYQLILNDAGSGQMPANLENVITAEGQAGAFTQNIQVKVPNDNSSLEYVIQQ